MLKRRLVSHSSPVAADTSISSSFPHENSDAQLSASRTLMKTKDGVYIVSEMPQPLPTILKNTYYLIRHGQSWGNVEGVISSARSLAFNEKHGLTPLGMEQGKDSASLLLKLIATHESNYSTVRRVFFCSSPFARARQTAQACLQGLKERNKQVDELNLDVQENILIEDGLMERFFGQLDDKAIDTYGYVWPIDMIDVTHTQFEVESVAAVATRLRETILKIDEIVLDFSSKTTMSTPDKRAGDIVVLVSHADVLQILQLYAAGATNVGSFSSYRFNNGEVRLMGRKPESLPEAKPLQPPNLVC